MGRAFDPPYLEQLNTASVDEFVLVLLIAALVALSVFVLTKIEPPRFLPWL